MTHELAIFAYESKETHVWDGDSPDSICLDVTLLVNE